MRWQDIAGSSSWPGLADANVFRSFDTRWHCASVRPGWAIYLSLALLSKRNRARVRPLNSALRKAFEIKPMPEILPSPELPNSRRW